MHFKLLISTLVFCSITCRSQIYFSGDKSLELTPDQELAVFWFDAIWDSTKLDSAFKISKAPFEWDALDFIASQSELEKIIKTVRIGGVIIDTVYSAHDSMKKFFRLPPSEIEVVAIEYYAPNNLRRQYMLIAVDPKHSKIRGLYYLGSIRGRRKYPVH